MRVLLAPDCFGGTLSAPEAAQALADGWRRVRPHDELVQVPLSDGGPGFVDVLPGERRRLVVEDPLARPVEAVWLLDGTTAYVECAQACGLHLLTEGERDPAVTTTYGVGQLVRAAVDAGATRVVLGLGGSATNDGGAGMLAALGVRREDAAGVRLDPGGLPLRDAARLVGLPVAVPGLVVATDVDAPLLGPHGATRVFGPQKGAGPELVAALEDAVAHWAGLLEDHLGVDVRDLPGAGAAGGLGFAALALGARREAGLDVVARAVGLADRVAAADLVLTGEGAFDATSLRGKVVSGVARAAQEGGLPCVVLAGQVAVGRREAAAAGVEQAYALADEVGLAEALARPAEALAVLASRAARDWGVG
ncbi:MAG: glycerate kinase family protein [Mycobacteriales bacterium]